MTAGPSTAVVDEPGPQHTEADAGDAPGCAGACPAGSRGRTGVGGDAVPRGFAELSGPAGAGRSEAERGTEAGTRGTGVVTAGGRRVAAAGVDAGAGRHGDAWVPDASGGTGARPVRAEVRTADAAAVAPSEVTGLREPGCGSGQRAPEDASGFNAAAPGASGPAAAGTDASGLNAAAPGASGLDAAAPDASAPPRAPRFVALGDSLTEGVGDRVGDSWRGWAALLAEGLSAAGAPARFRNLAVSGALTQDVAERQAPEALAYEPDIASVVVGVNDTLRCTFDIEDLTLRLDEVCAALSARGTVLLTACLPDPGTMLGLPVPLARPLARRQRAVNAVVHALSNRYGALHLHAADGPWVADRSMWSADRLHPGERGHRMIAARFHELLAARGLAHGAAPASEPDQPSPTRSASLLWLATAGTGWVARRCTDLLPQLLRMAGAEVRHWARGTSARLDHSAEHALSSALAAVSLDVPLARMGE